jgi:hypothetical protein
VLPILAMAMQLCLATLSVTTQVHADDDALCNPQLVLHDHDGHGVHGDRTAPAAPEHCFICHSLSLRALLSTLRVAPPDTSVGTRTDFAVAVPYVAFQHRLPARAPPLA